MLSGTGLGYWPDPISTADHDFELLGIGSAPPTHASVKQWAAPIPDQLATESCVGQAMRQAFYIEEHRLTGNAPDPTSALGHYFNARAQQGIEDMDVGANPRAALAALKYHGALRERDWPFDPDKVNRRPPWRAYQHAFDSRGPHRYYRIGTSGTARIRDLQRAIAAGHAPIFGTVVSEDFVRADGEDTEDAPGPSATIAGGHMLCAVEYEPGRMLIANSWSRYYRLDGFVWMSEQYMADERTGDLWVLAL